MKAAAIEIFGTKRGKLIVETCGSYRRGKEQSGDVDVLISVDSLSDSRK